MASKTSASSTLNDRCFSTKKATLSRAISTRSIITTTDWQAMTLKSLSEDKPVGVIGAGNFGSAVANLLAPRRKVLLYARDETVIEQIHSSREHRGHQMHPNVLA